MGILKFNELYSQNKTRSFVLHLIRAYVPATDVKKVWRSEIRNLKCCMCSKPLSTVEELFNKVTTDKELMKEYLNFSVEKFKTPEDSFNCVNPITKILIEKPQAWEGKKTKTFMCADCILELITFVQEKLMQEDKQIVYAVNNEMVKEFPELKGIEPPSVSKIKKKEKERFKGKTMIPSNLGKIIKSFNSGKPTFGDLLDESTKKKLGLYK